MFENQNPPAGSQNQGVNPLASPAGGPQSTSSASPADRSADRPAVPQDMFSEVESVSTVGQAPRPIPPKPAVFQPRPASPAGGLYSAPGAPAAPAGRPYNFEEAAPKTNIKKLLVLGGLVLALAAIVGGGYFGYKKYSGLSTGKSENTLNPEINNENSNNTANIQPADNPVQPEVKTATSPTVAGESAGLATGTTAIAAPKDSDDDGLTDEEEAALGTNPNAVDSDSDGLFDREEVKVYGTDPLKADTDGDGYSDGVEVKGGFNPLGWGKLFDASNPAANKPR